MSIFYHYAHFYDRLYEDKDYSAECDFLEEVFGRFAEAPVRGILDLGCGTGGHAVILADRGYDVTGVDRSEVMLAAAREKVGDRTIRLHQADVREVRLGRKFDAVISMFAVMSYMTTNEDLEAVFRTAREHLNPGGLFVFDAWFGPGVFSDPPTDRMKEVVNGDERIIRFAHPEMDVVKQVVTVNFRVLRFRGNELLEDVSEAHPMRPLFVQEIEFLAQRTGMAFVNTYPFLELDKSVHGTDWIVFSILQSAIQERPFGAFGS